MARKQGSKALPATKANAAAGLRRDTKVGHELRAAAPATEPQEVGVRSHNIRFDLTSEIAYHAIREQFFGRLNRFLTGLQVLLGTSAFAAFLTWFPSAAIWLVAVSSLAGVILLVIDPAAAARDHRALRSRLHAIRAGLEEVGEDDKTLRAARGQMIRISADAPPAYRCAQAIAYNSAVNAMYPPEMASLHRYKVGFWHGLFANVLPMRGHQFAKENPAKAETTGT